MNPTTASRFLAQEARALLTRLEGVKSFGLNMPMVSAATGSHTAHLAMERHLVERRRELQRRVHAYIKWLAGPDGRQSPPAEAQRRFTVLRLRFNAVLDQLDIFADVLTQRSEHEYGVWLAGLDVAAADALTLPGDYYQAPPVICYLDRGHGAAIRRARTRLPGGAKNPVAIVRVPRERMVGSGIASSLVHEVGHQGAALLDLVNSSRTAIGAQQKQGGANPQAWRLWGRWISEIIADFWALANLGVAATLGLIGVVSLPRGFVFRIKLDDPHPFPWIRAKLSCAMGHLLYPHPQWERLARLWESFYPKNGLAEGQRRIVADLESSMPKFINLLMHHRPRALRGKSIIEVFPLKARQPARLQAHYEDWRSSPILMNRASPTLVFAVIGQAKADGKISPEAENRILTKLLAHWALRSTRGTTTFRAK